MYGPTACVGAARPRELIEAAVDRIAGSAALRNSPALVAFLRFVVAAVLAGHGHSIKAYTIAVDALGRSVDFDPAADASVRVQAGRLRSALATYYRSEGEADPVLIEVPRGSYVPRISVREGGNLLELRRTSQHPRQERPLEASLDHSTSIHRWQDSPRPVSMHDPSAHLGQDLIDELRIRQSLHELRNEAAELKRNIAEARIAIAQLRATLAALPSFAPAGNTALEQPEITGPEEENGLLERKTG